VVAQDQKDLFKLNHHPVRSFPRSLREIFLMSRPPLLAGSVAQRKPPRTLSACACVEGAVTPGIASLNPGLMSAQPFRAAGLHAGGVKEISPR